MYGWQLMLMLCLFKQKSVGPAEQVRGRHQ